MKTFGGATSSLASCTYTLCPPESSSDSHSYSNSKADRRLTPKLFGKIKH